MTHTVDLRLRKKIEELVGAGVRLVQEMCHHLNLYIIMELFDDDELPQPTNHRFYPTNKDIRGFINKATIKHR